MLWGTLDCVILGNFQFVIQVRIIFYVIRLCCVVTLSVRTVKLCHVCHYHVIFTQSRGTPCSLSRRIYAGSFGSRVEGFFL